MHSVPYFDNSITASVETWRGKASKIDHLIVGNADTTKAVYLQLFDVDTGTTVTLGTTTPTYVVPVPKGSASDPGLAGLPLGTPMGFRNGIKYALTTTSTGSTAPASAGFMSGATLSWNRRNE